ncbi:hypothetical protein KC867_01170 [Candidatus Saccharibacteria bacterium]|nr:hypothetical protein [Candidatus Saccharibacteria bacterium]
MANYEQIQLDGWDYGYVKPNVLCVDDEPIYDAFGVREGAQEYNTQLLLPEVAGVLGRLVIESELDD